MVIFLQFNSNITSKKISDNQAPVDEGYKRNRQVLPDNIGNDLAEYFIQQSYKFYFWSSPKK